MSSGPLNDRLIDSKALGFMAFALAWLAGGFLRLYNLGTLPIDGDNSYHALAARAILEEGIPLMQSGQLYTRSLPLLYLEALSAKLFGFSEWSLRFPSALMGIVNVLLVHRLVKALWREEGPALLAGALFALSPWAIHISRMPRMYEAYLMAVLLTWILFVHWYYHEKGVLLVPLLLCSILALMLHQSAIIPLTCFLAPALLEGKLNRKAAVALGCFAGLAILWKTLMAGLF
jgi:4-amino-4-deoxy-L-arabinose transferase-like glycosyltransferase